jgi:multiple sugar transport system permease protein
MALTHDRGIDQAAALPPGVVRVRARAEARRSFFILHSSLFIWYGLLVILAALTLVPIIWMVLTAFKAPYEVAQIPPTWWPSSWHPENFAEAWRALSIMVLEVATSALAAYAFARLRFRGRDGLFLLYLGTLMIPRQVTLIPLFILMRELRWVDTYQGLILPQAFSAFGTFLLRQFFLTIPFELEDAARVDGASRLQCLVRIILPLSGPALATLAVFILLFQWNNLLWPLVMSNSDATRPIAVGLRVFQGQWGTEWHLLMAAATLAVIPMVVLYLAAQRWFVRGIALTGFGGR